LFFVVSGVFAQKFDDITIDSKELKQKREIVVYTPMNYHDQYTCYHVIYVFDAQDRPLYDYVNSIAHLIKENHEGFIVVGIKAIYDPVNFYARNHDLLPSTTSRNMGPKSKGNAENFLKYVKNEVIPYVENNYRTLKHKTAVGHSLGASFLLYAMMNESSLFDNIIAVSPNLADDNQRLVNQLATFDPKQYSSTKFLYVSHADEGKNSDYVGWGEANENAYKILRNDLNTENLKVVVEEYPSESHRSGYIPSVRSAITIYMNEIEPVQEKLLSRETFEVTFKIKVPDENDEIFITGNQESLGNWKPDKIKMNKKSPFEREITLQVQDPVEVKFTKGSWDSEAWMSFSDNSLGRTSIARMFRPKEGMEVYFEIAGYR
jgi:predicted alpha/beta superfamily hydrolase